MLAFTISAHVLRIPACKAILQASDRCLFLTGPDVRAPNCRRCLFEREGNEASP
jgi:hypothetical protein